MEELGQSYKLLKVKYKKLGPRRWIGILQRDAAGYLDYMEAVLNALDGPPHEVLKKVKGLDKDAYGSTVTKFLAKNLAHDVRACLRYMAYEHTARIGLALERYRLKRGELPKKLSELTPDYLPFIPLDPFDGQPIRYKQLDPGYVVYSIGEDLSDDGGKEGPSKQSRKKKEPWDVTFTVER